MRRLSDTPGLEYVSGKPRWRAPKRAVKLGFRPTVIRLGGDDQTIAARCRDLWGEMEAWIARRPTAAFDGTIGGLLTLYASDPDSPYRDLKYSTRRSYDDDMKVLIHTVGARRLDKLTGQDFHRWYANLRQPASPGGPERVRRAHGVMKMLRITLGYGVVLGIPDCERLRVVLSVMRFKGPRPRERFLSYEQALAIIAKAHELGEPEMALGQALQFECMLRQIDVIGEWIPGQAGRRWANGLLWQHISKDLVLEKRTTKRGTLALVDLREYPLVLAELQRIPPENRVGPVLINSRTGLPFHSREAYATRWRSLARAAGVPDDVWNRDSRAGGVTEGSDAGADIEHLRQAASHTSTQTTQRYNRKTLAKTTTVARLRVAHRERKE